MQHQILSYDFYVAFLYWVKNFSLNSNNFQLSMPQANLLSDES